MANNTIYPYGTGGQLPSGIAIVNDLTTGGADKALSAEQGKVLNELIESSMLPVAYATVEEDGIFFVDSYLNIGAKIDDDGVVGVNIPVIENV